MKKTSLKTHLPHPAPGFSGFGRRRRRGVAILLLLCVMSIATALSYAIMRGSSNSVTLRANHMRRAEARNAALAGLAIARQAMSAENWQGVTTPLAGTLGPHTRYEANYQVGDASLQPSDADYQEYPYRVTIRARGIVEDPSNPHIATSAEVEAVVQLIRRAVGPQDEDWQATQASTLHQWSGGHDLLLNLPCHVAGRVHSEGDIRIADDIPSFAEGALDGRLDELALIDTELSASTILDIYNSSLGIPSGSYANQEQAYLVQQPVHWWRFDEPDGSTIAMDSGSESWPGTYRGVKLESSTPSFVAQSHGEAIDLDGSEAFVDLGPRDFASIEHGSPTAWNTFSVLAWLRIGSVGSQSVPILTKSRGADADAHIFTLGLEPAGSAYRVSISATTENGNFQSTASGATLVGNTWYFVALTYNGSKFFIYVNGIELAELSSPGGDVVADPRVPLQIGASTAIRKRYLEGLRSRYEIGFGDSRPFEGPIEYDPSKVAEFSQRHLETDLGFTGIYDASTAKPDSAPGAPGTYQLYPGGPQYAIPTLAAYETNLTSQPDPITNPLGVLRYDDEVTLGSGCTIDGVILGDNKRLTLAGPNIVVRGIDLPPLESGIVHQPPVLMAKGDVDVQPHANTTIDGCVVVWKFLRVLSGPQSDEFHLRGRLLAEEWEVEPRTDWQRDQVWWANSLQAYYEQLGGGLDTLPEYLRSTDGFDFEPKILVEPPSPARSYHWHNWDDPMFQAHPDDGGLRWQMLRMSHLE